MGQKIQICWDLLVCMHRHFMGCWGNRCSLQMMFQWSHPWYKLWRCEWRGIWESTFISEAAHISELPRQGATKSEPQDHQWGPGSYHTHIWAFTWCQFADSLFLWLREHWGTYSPINRTTTYSLGLMGFLSFFSPTCFPCPNDGELLSTKCNSCS